MNKNNNFKLLDVVALLKNIYPKKLLKGQVGTIVEVLDKDVYEVEFSNRKGETLLTTPVHSKDIILLHCDLAEISH